MRRTLLIFEFELLEIFFSHCTLWACPLSQLLAILSGGEPACISFILLLFVILCSS